MRHLMDSRVLRGPPRALVR